MKEKNMIIRALGCDHVVRQTASMFRMNLITVRYPDAGDSRLLQNNNNIAVHK